MKIKFLHGETKITFPLDRCIGIYPWPDGVTVSAYTEDAEIADAILVLTGELARRQEAAGVCPEHPGYSLDAIGLCTAPCIGYVNGHENCPPGHHEPVAEGAARHA